MPTVTPSREAVQTPVPATSKWGLGREVQAALLRVRTRPECPRGQSEGTYWDSKPDCGIATSSPNLRHHQACSQNKVLSRASWLQTSPSPSRHRQAGQPEPEGGNCSSREASSNKLQAGFVANQDLGFWMVNIHLRRCAGCTPRKPSGRDGGGDKLQWPCSPNTWSSELFGPGKGTKRRPNRVCTFEDYLSAWTRVA